MQRSAKIFLLAVGICILYITLLSASSFDADIDLNLRRSSYAAGQGNGIRVGLGQIGQEQPVACGPCGKGYSEFCEMMRSVLILNVVRRR